MVKEKKGRAKTKEEAKQYPYYDEDYDISYSEMPSNKVKRHKEKTQSNNDTSEVSYTLDTDQNLQYRDKVKKADEQVRQTALSLPGILQSIGLNFTSPTQIGRGIYNSVVNGDNFFQNVYFGNNGVVPDNIMQNYPILSTAINTVADGGIYGGVTKFYRWGTTPKLIGSGVEARVYSSPFSRKVYKVGLDPEYVSIKNNTTQTVPHKLVGYTLEKQPVYSQLKMRVPTKFNPKRLGNLYQRLANSGFFPNEMFGQLDAINPITQTAITDLGVGNIGQNIFGQYKLIDPAVLNINEYMSLFKKGGKMNAIEQFKKYRKFRHGSKGVSNNEHDNRNQK